jgi:hypothetical protein
MKLEEKKWFTNGHIWFTEDDCHASQTFVERIGYKRVNGKWVRPDGSSAHVAKVAEASKPAAGRTEILESRGDLAHLNESQKKQIADLEAYAAETTRLGRLRDGYLAMGLSMSEAGIAAGLEVKITSNKKFWESFEF